MNRQTVTRRSVMPAGRFVRPAGFAMLALLLGSQASIRTAAASPASGLSIVAFSSARISSPVGRSILWTRPDNIQAAVKLIEFLDTAELDGLKSSKFNPGKLKRALRDASRGDPRDQARAEQLLNDAYVRYVSQLRANSRGKWEVVDASLVPRAPTAQALLSEAAAQPSLTDYIGRMGFMHESYAGLRRAMASVRQARDRQAAALIGMNMQRARFLPSSGKYVLVNAAAQRLYMYENGRIVDSMKVVVGKPEQPTPMMAALIRFTNLNPYWNLPTDLVAERVAPNVLKDGMPYLKAKGYVILSDYGEKAKIVDPKTVNWTAVQNGTVQLRMRQNPGPQNAMGRMKFMFPNRQGVYLHDTPNKELLGEDARLFSAGCVRLEDAPRLGKWLYGKPLRWQGQQAEAKVALKQPVPVYLAYLTATQEGNQLTFYTDIYGRDRAMMAGTNGRQYAAR
nr:L,D-transpeptidase family protein [uncultured Sphingomonas sp.]